MYFVDHMKCVHVPEIYELSLGVLGGRFHG